MEKLGGYHKELHSGSLQLCLQILDLGNLTDVGKHSSFLLCGINYDCKKFYSIGSLLVNANKVNEEDMIEWQLAFTSGAQYYKNFTIVNDNRKWL